MAKIKTFQVASSNNSKNASSTITYIECYKEAGYISNTFSKTDGTETELI